MAGEKVRYDSKAVQTVRGLEARTKAKWEKEGWEFVSQDVALVRSTLNFRRVHKRIPVWPFLVGAGALVLVVAGFTYVGVSGANQPPAASKSAATNQTVMPAPTPTPAPSTASVPTEAEVVSAFKAYFAERASAGVMVGKAATDVSYSNRIVHVTFDPAAAGVSTDTFTQLNAFDNLADFAAATIAFNNDTGSRLRPYIDSIETVRSDGSPLGTLSHKQILAINGLSS